MSLTQASHRGVRAATLLLVLMVVLASAGRVLAAPSAAPTGASDPHASRSRSGAIPPKAAVPQPAAGQELYWPAYNPDGDTAEASRADRNASVIIGSDDRARITPTTTFPHRAMVQIVSSFGTCSGFLIDADTVATAGHCVYKHSAGGWVPSVTVYPARDGSSTFPYGSCTDTQVYTTAGWMDDKKAGYDYGAIKLNCTVGNTTGWLGLRVVGDPTGQKVSLSGYPNSKPLGTLWRGTGTVMTAQTTTIRYNNDSSGGQDGGPVWNSQNGTCGPCAIGIHSKNNVNASYNQGVRVTQSVYNNYATWSA